MLARKMKVWSFASVTPTLDWVSVPFKNWPATSKFSTNALRGPLNRMMPNVARSRLPPNCSAHWPAWNSGAESWAARDAGTRSSASASGLNEAMMHLRNRDCVGGTAVSLGACHKETACHGDGFLKWLIGPVMRAEEKTERVH